MLGSWEINVNIGGMPQKIATAVGKLSEQLIGAEYTPIAYLGSQVVNGTNHAVLAEQLVTTGKDTKNIVILIFNEKQNEMEAILVGIERVIESGGELGGIKVDAITDIPEYAMDAFDEAREGYVGMKIDPFALLGTQVTKGTNYIFAAKATPVVANPKDDLSLIIANPMTGDFIVSDLIGAKNDVTQLGYAFTWLKRQNTSLGSPLGEYP